MIAKQSAIDIATILIGATVLVIALFWFAASRYDPADVTAAQTPVPGCEYVPVQGLGIDNWRLVCE